MSEPSQLTFFTTRELYLELKNRCLAVGLIMVGESDAVQETGQQYPARIFCKADNLDATDHLIDHMYATLVKLSGGPKLNIAKDLTPKDEQ